MAVPLAPAGDSLLISDGRLASRRLNAIKKKNSPNQAAVSEDDHCHSAIVAMASSAIAPQRMAFIFLFFSPMMIQVTMAKKEVTITVR